MPLPPQSFLVPVPPPSDAALDRRIRRLMEPNVKGEYKIAEDVRNMWKNGQKEHVFKLFAQCGNNPEKFIKQHSVKKSHEREMEVGVYFTFQVESQFADRSEKLSCI